MNSLIGRALVLCEAHRDANGNIALQNLTKSINALVSNPATSLFDHDLEVLCEIIGITPHGEERSVPLKKFWKNFVDVFADSFTPNESGEIAPFDTIASFRDIYNGIDEDRDGKVFPEQMSSLVRGLSKMTSSGISRSPDAGSVEMIVAHLDREKKGYVTYSDFLRGSLSAKSISSSSGSPFGNNGNDDDDDDDEFKTAFAPSSSGEIGNSNNQNKSSSIGIMDVPGFDELTFDQDSPNPNQTTGMNNSSNPSTQTSSSLNQGNLMEIQKLKSDISRLEQQLSSTQNELTTSETSRSQLLSRIDEYERSIEQYKKQSKLINDAESSHRLVSEELEQVKLSLSQAREQIKTQQRKETEILNERDKLSQELFQTKREINDAEDQIRSLKELVSSVSADKSTLAKLQAELQSQLAEIEKLKRDQIQKEQANVDLAEKLRTLQAKHEEVVLDMEVARRKLSELTDDKNASVSSPMRPKGGNLKSELETSSVLRAHTTSPPTTVSPARLPTSRSGHSSSNAETGDSNLVAPSLPEGAHDDNNSLKIQIDMLEKEKKGLLTHLSNAGARTTQLEKEKSEMNSKITSLSNDLSASEREKSALQRKVLDIESQLEQARVTLSAQKDAVISANDAAAKATASAFLSMSPSSSSSNLAISSNNALGSDSSEDHLRQLRIANRENEEQIQKLKSQVDADVVQMKALRVEIQTLRDSNRSLKGRLAQVPEDATIPMEDDMKRGLIGNSRVNRHDRGCCSCCSGCTIM